MINKFLLGGKQDALMQFVLGLAETLLVNPEDIIKIALLKPDALKAAVQTYQETQDMKYAALAFQLIILLLTTAAKHGAKLQYLKSLKNQCAEDEEVVYFKKGGSVNCGCKKKKIGGELNKETKDSTTVKNFKNKRNNSTVETDPTNGGKNVYDIKLKKYRSATKEELAKQKENNRLAYHGQGEGNPQHKCGGKVKKEACGSKMEKASCGTVAKFKKAKCGAKMKKHQLGGNLNRIPFMQKAGKLPTAPKAEDRYKESYKSWNWPLYKEVTAGSILFPGAKISLTVEGSDTTYRETPPRFPFVKVVSRTAKNNAKTIKWRDLITGQTYTEVRRGNSQEYETLKRRFNTAWNLAK